MRYLFAIVLVLLVQQTASAEILVGTAVLKFQRSSKYQPGSCATQTLAKAEGDELEEICIDMWSWQIHEVIGFRDLKGNRHKIKSLVATAHNPTSGEWFLVLEKLSEEEAAKFGAQYKVVDRSRVRQAVCLDSPIEEYTGSPNAPSRLGETEGHYCYDMSSLNKTEQPRKLSLPTEQGKVTYYDRDRNSTVDLEIHELGCCNRNWALADSDSDGRYDFWIVWGRTVLKVATDTPVPQGMSVSRKDTPKWATQLR